MNDRNKTHGALWMFSYEAAGARPREVEFDPTDPIYHLYRTTRNPYLERAIAPPARKLERSPGDLQKLFRFFAGRPQYQVRPVNAEAPYARRALPHPAPPPAREPHYLVPGRLRGNLTRLPWMIDLFFRAVLSRLHGAPATFGEVVEELMEQFRQDGIRIRIYEAYLTLQDWDDLITTLEEIARYPSPETFDLFCSALFAYYDLVYPPEAG